MTDRTILKVVAKKKTANGKQHQRSEHIRMDAELKACISKYQELVRKDGIEISFSEAARSLIKKGWEAVQ